MVYPLWWERELHANDPERLRMYKNTMGFNQGGPVNIKPQQGRRNYQKGGIVDSRQLVFGPYTDDRQRAFGPYEDDIERTQGVKR